MSNYTFEPEDVNIASWSSEAKSEHGWSLEHTYRGAQVTHLPTGIVIQVDSERSQHRNLDIAFDELEEILKEDNR